MPSRKVTQKEYKTRFKPWITDRILSITTEKKQALKDLINCTNPVSTTEHQNRKYETIKNKVYIELVLKKIAAAQKQPPLENERFINLLQRKHM